MKKETKKKANPAEIEDLRIRLEEAEEALRAIRSGEVDALIVTGPQGEEVFTLKGAEQPYRIFIEAMNEGAVTLDPQGNILYCNHRFAEMLETSPDKIIGSSIYQFIPPTDTSDFESAFQTGKREKTIVDLSLKKKDDQLLPVHLSFNTLHGGDVPVVCMVATDLTERKRYEQEILKSHAELEMKVQERTEDLTKINEDLKSEISERKRADEALKKARDELDIQVQERTADLSQAMERLRIENMERKRLEDILRESERQVRFFASQCLTAQESERKRVAGELHDSIAASLGAVKFKIGKIVEEMKQGNGGLESLQDLGSMVTEINNDVRRIMADLRPSVLDDLGIIAALGWFCREYQKTYSHISVDSQIGILEPDVSDSLKTPIFRICQEAMNNIARHGKATLVNLSLRKEGDKILLTIQDNGQGFDLETVRKGMGLSTMKERARLSGGAFALESAMGKGTLIRASWTL